MKTKNLINKKVLVVSVLTSILVLSGCGRKSPKQYGQQIAGRAPTQIDGILKEPASFDGKTVTIEGVIAAECMTGCWFDVAGEGGKIHVDVKPSGFAIPQKVGKKVIVEGQVSLRDGHPTLIGKGVEIK